MQVEIIDEIYTASARKIIDGIHIDDIVQETETIDPSTDTATSTESNIITLRATECVVTHSASTRLTQALCYHPLDIRELSAYSLIKNEKILAYQYLRPNSYALKEFIFHNLGQNVKTIIDEIISILSDKESTHSSLKKADYLYKILNDKYFYNFNSTDNYLKKRYQENEMKKHNDNKEMEMIKLLVSDKLRGEDRDRIYEELGKMKQ